MKQGSSVLAVVDCVDDAPVIWWVDLGPRAGRMSRLVVDQDSVDALGPDAADERSA